MITRKYSNNISYLAKTSARAIPGNECHHVYSVAKFGSVQSDPQIFSALAAQNQFVHHAKGQMRG